MNITGTGTIYKRQSKRGQPYWVIRFPDKKMNGELYWGTVMVRFNRKLEPKDGENVQVKGWIKFLPPKKGWPERPYLFVNELLADPAVDAPQEAIEATPPAVDVVILPEGLEDEPYTLEDAPEKAKAYEAWKMSHKKGEDDA